MAAGHHELSHPGHEGGQVMALPYFPDAELATSDDVVVSENT